MTSPVEPTAWKEHDDALVVEWSRKPNRRGTPKTDESQGKCLTYLKPFLDAADKPVRDLTIQDIQQYLAGKPPGKHLEYIIAFLKWTFANGIGDQDVAHAFKHRNPRTPVQVISTLDDDDARLVECWMAACRLTKASSATDYRRTMLRVRSFLGAPLDGIVPADVERMNLSPRDHSLGMRLANWLAVQRDVLAVSEVAAPVSPVDSVPEWLPKLETKIRHLLNFQETIETVIPLWNHEFALLREEQPALEARLAALETGGARSADAWPLLASRIAKLETLFAGQDRLNLDERLTNLDRRHATTKVGLAQCMKLLNNLVVICYTGSSPIHPIDAEDRENLSVILQRFWIRNEHLFHSTEDANHSPTAPVASLRNGVAHAPGDDDKWPE